MRLRFPALLLILVIGLVAHIHGASAGPRYQARPFRAADLKVEISAADGTAGLQVLLDGDAWQGIGIADPAGHKLVELEAAGQLRDYGLTELFAETSGRQFAKFPLERFTQLFPEGDYAFTGTLVDGTKLRSDVPLTHDFPDVPRIVQPRDGAMLASDQVVVRWEPGQRRPGVTIVGHHVAVVREDGARTLSADLPASARQFPVPAAFLQRRREYNAEVRAIETSGNHTVSEVTFTVA